MSDDKIDASELADVKSGLASAEKVEHEKLTSVLKCTACGNTDTIPTDLQSKMDADEDLGALPACSACGGATGISITSV